MKPTCTGPGPNGERCAKPMRTNELCTGHDWQQKKKGVLTPLKGKGGRKYAPDSVRVELRNVPKEQVGTLDATGAKVPATDNRETSAVNRGARWLFRAYAEGGVKLKASHRTNNALPQPAKRKAAECSAVIVKNVDGAVREALSSLGQQLPRAHMRDTCLVHRGARYLIQAYHEKGLTVLKSHAPKGAP